MELNIEKKYLSRLPAVVAYLLLLTTLQSFAQDKSPAQAKPAAQTSSESKAPNIIINAEED
jgi:hypothetical protein